MGENLYNSAHKATNEAYRDGHDSVKWEHKTSGVEIFEASRELMSDDIYAQYMTAGESEYGQ